MIDYEFNGLPVHALIVHFTVVIVPLAALCVVLAALWPAARRRLGIVAPLLALAALIAVPVTVAAGEWLQMRVAATPLVDRHATLGTTLLPWVIALFVVAAVQWAWHRFGASAAQRVRVVAAIVLAVAAVASAVGAVLTVVLIGESGAAAVWTGSFG